MGYLSLHVYPNAIDVDAWTRVYRESVQLLRDWPDPLLCARSRTVGGREVRCFTRDCVTETGWRVIGDARSLRFAGEFHFPADLPARASEESRRELDVEHAEEDILLSLLPHGTWTPAARPLDLFGRQTLGGAYFSFAMAVGTLVEKRFPRRAVVSGDLDNVNAAHVCKQLERLLGERFDPPVVVVPSRVRERLAGRVPEQVVARFLGDYAHVRNVGPRVVAEMVGLATGYDREDLFLRLDSDFLSSDPTLLMPEDQAKAIALGARVLDAMRDFQLDPRFSESSTDRGSILYSIVEGMKFARIELTDATWNRIEGADLSEIRLLAAFASLDLRALGNPDLARAFVENRRLRRFALSRARVSGNVIPLKRTAPANGAARARRAHHDSEQ